MNYLQLDNFNGTLNIIYKNDGSGEPLIFKTLTDAEDTLEENCQSGIIVPLKDSIELFKKIDNLFSSGKFFIEEETTEDRKNFSQLKSDIKRQLNKK